MFALLSASHLQRRDAIERCADGTDNAVEQPGPCDGVYHANGQPHWTTSYHSYQSTFLSPTTTELENTSEKRVRHKKPRKRRPSRVMSSYVPPKWITAWFLLTAPVVLWDASYVFMRPRSFEGGDLHWIWEPYSIYQNIDRVYSPEAYENNEGFPNAQSFMNVIETFLNLLFIYRAHITRSPEAPLIGFTAATLTLGKTMLYLLVEHFCTYCSVGQLPVKDLLLYYVLPNGFWIVLPLFIVVSLGRDISARLAVVEKLNYVKKA